MGEDMPPSAMCSQHALVRLTAPAVRSSMVLWVVVPIVQCANYGKWVAIRSIDYLDLAGGLGKPSP